MNIFNIKLEFDHQAFRQAIERCIADNDKGYVCVVDGNVLTMAQKDEAYRKIVMNAYVNTCDGGSIANMCNKIYGTNYTAFTGPMVFAEYIERTQYRQMLLGNTEEKFTQIKNKLKANGKEFNHLDYMPVPFVTIDEFDYEGIARQINELKPNIIWVSLGAPKQEKFMARLIPYIDSGIMFGIGAAFNFYVDGYKPSRLIWFKRLFQEPKKQIRRCLNYLSVMPKVYREEKCKLSK